MKMSTITWLAAIIIMGYYLCNLAEAYYQAMNMYMDARNSKAYSVLMETK